MTYRFDHIEVIDDAMVEILRKKTPAEKLAMVDQFWRFARDMLRETVSREHPDWTEDQVQREVAQRISTDALEEECYKKIPVSLFL